MNLLDYGAVHGKGQGASLEEAFIAAKKYILSN